MTFGSAQHCILHDPIKIARPLGLYYNPHVSIALSLGLRYNLARPLGLHYNHYMSPSVRPWSGSENALNSS